MLNKPIKISKFATLSLVLVFWLSGVALFAQNKQVNSTEPEKEQIPIALPKLSLSNQLPKDAKKDEATTNKAAIEQKRREEQAMNAKKQSLAKESAAEVKHSKSAQTFSSKAPNISAQKATNKNLQNTDNSKKDYEIKKAKLVQSLKDKNYSQKEIDRIVSKMDANLNLKNNNSKK